MPTKNEQSKSVENLIKVRENPLIEKLKNLNEQALSIT